MLVAPTHVQISVFDAEQKIDRLPLFIRDKHVADWKLTMSVNLDSTGSYLKVMRSGFTLLANADKVPLVRYEFDDNMHTAPIAHWQFDTVGGWKGAIFESRARYRTIQARTIARDMQSEVADALRGAGWSVEPPRDIEEPGQKFLSRW